MGLGDFFSNNFETNDFLDKDYATHYYRCDYNSIKNVNLCPNDKYIDPGVQSTIITGGCMVMSAIFGLLFGEKITKKVMISLFFAVAGTICIMF